MSASAAFIGDHEANVADNITPVTIVTLIAGVFPAWQQCSHSDQPALAGGFRLAQGSVGVWAAVGC